MCVLPGQPREMCELSKNPTTPPFTLVPVAESAPERQLLEPQVGAAERLMVIGERVVLASELAAHRNPIRQPCEPHVAPFIRRSAAMLVMLLPSFRWCSMPGLRGASGSSSAVRTMRPYTGHTGTCGSRSMCRLRRGRARAGTHQSLGGAARTGFRCGAPHGTTLMLRTTAGSGR